MILRDLAHSIRRQDWFAVAIEFLIVVAGIFVGLQVTDWNERRQLRERELNYLQRMSEDLSKMEAEFHQILEYGGDRSEVVMRALRALEQCDASLATPDDFRITFADYQTQPTPTIITRTYEEMVWTFPTMQRAVPTCASSTLRPRAGIANCATPPGRFAT